MALTFAAGTPNVAPLTVRARGAAPARGARTGTCCRQGPSWRIDRPGRASSSSCSGTSSAGSWPVASRAEHPRCLTKRVGISTITDVARVAGVSVATVSRALRGLDRVSPQTRQRVLEVAEELHYVASPTATSLASGRTRVVAVVVPFLTRWFFATLVSAIEKELRRHEPPRDPLRPRGRDVRPPPAAEPEHAVEAGRRAHHAQHPDERRRGRARRPARPAAGLGRGPGAGTPLRPHRRRAGDADRRRAPHRPRARADRLHRRRPPQRRARADAPGPPPRVPRDDGAGRAAARGAGGSSARTGRPRPLPATARSLLLQRRPPVRHRRRVRRDGDRGARDRPASRRSTCRASCRSSGSTTTCSPRSSGSRPSARTSRPRAEPRPTMLLRGAGRPRRAESPVDDERAPATVLVVRESTATAPVS